MPLLCKQRVETSLGDEVGDNGTRLPAPSLNVRGQRGNTQISPAQARCLDLIRQKSVVQAQLGPPTRSRLP